MEKPDLNKPVFRIYPKAKKLVLAGKCPLCKKSINEEDFRDALSIREYSISGICQSCQDSTFEYNDETSL